METINKNLPPTSIWQGKTIRLRAIEPTDWEAYFKLDQDEEQARALYFVPFPPSQNDSKRFAEEAASKKPEGDNFRFVIENRENEVVGDVTTHYCNQRNGSFSWGITIKQEHRRMGYATESLLLVMRYYFQELRYQKVTVTIYSFNEASTRLHERLGFQQEGRIRRTVFTRGQFFDELIYGLTGEEYVAKHVEITQIKVKKMRVQADPGGSGNPKLSQPRMFGSYMGTAELPWIWAIEQLNGARNYWIATTRPDGKPHCRPVWGVWFDNTFYFSTGSLSASNLASQPEITVHLESGSKVVIIEGVAEPISETTLVEHVVSQYNHKYNWNTDPYNLPGPFYAVRPLVAFGWHFEESELNPESTGLETATRWQF